MKFATARIERSSSTQLRKAVFGSAQKSSRLGWALGLALLTTTAFAEVVGYFKFDNFPNQLAAFTDDSGKGLRGLLGFPFTPPGSVAGPSGQAGDRAVALDGNAALVVDDSAAGLINILTPPLTVECWVRSSADTQVGVYRSFFSYGIPGGPPVPGLVRGGYGFGLGPSGDLRFTMFAVVDVFSGVPFPFDGQWHHVAAVYSAADGGVHFYLDGVEVAFVTEARNLTAPGTRHLDIGAFGTGLGRWIGDIDRARISKAALTVEQLDFVADTVKPVQNNTALFFNFDQGALPYQGQGQAVAGVAISTADWAINHPPWRSSGGPNASAAGPLTVTDTPSAKSGDLAVSFGQPPNIRTDVAAVFDPLAY